MRVTETFEAHVDSVRRLMNFDRIIVDTAIHAVERLRERLVQRGVNNPYLNVEGTLRALQGVRANDSLRPSYEAVFNQALVLLVSYFASALHDVFRRGVAHVLRTGGDASLFKEEIKLSVRELRDVSDDFANAVPDLLIQAKDVSFQDMQSVARSFKDYLDVTVQRDQFVHDIILGQACRHVIVHTAGVADERLIRQVANARPRRVKNNLVLDERIQFAPEEVELIGESMVKYLETLSEAVQRRVGADI